MKEQEFKVGDVVERIGGMQWDVVNGDVGVIVDFSQGWPVVEVPGKKTGHHNPEYLRSVTPKYQLTNHAKYIDAMEATIRKYGEALGGGDRVPFNWRKCSLCLVNQPEAVECDEFRRGVIACKECPNITVGKKLCVKPASENYPSRIIELREWKRIYQDDLERITAEEAEKEAESERKAPMEKVWEPLKIELTLETPEEAALYWALANAPSKFLKDFVTEQGSPSIDRQGPKQKFIKAAIDQRDRFTLTCFSEIDNALKKDQ